jgi:WD40 repeat protein
LSEQRGTEVAFGAATAVAAQAAAVRRAEEAQSLALAFASRQALSADDSDLALALAIESNRIADPPPQARFQLAQAAYAPGTRRLYANGDENLLEAIAVSPNGRYLLTGDYSSKMNLWDTETGAVLQTHTFGAEDEVQTVREQTFNLEAVLDLQFVDDSTAVVASGDSVVIWDVENWQEISRMQQGGSVVYSIDVRAQLVLAGYSNGDIRLFDIETGETLAQYRGHREQINDVAFSPDGRTILSGSWDATLRLWDTKDGTELQRFEPTVEGEVDDSIDVNSVAFSPNGETVLAAVTGGDIVVFSIETGEEVNRLRTGNTLNEVRFSPDGNSLTYASFDFNAYMADPVTGGAQRRFSGHRAAVSDLAFSPDGLTLFTGSNDGSVRQWYVNSGAELHRFNGYNDPAAVTSLAVSADGRTFLSGGGMDNPALILWDAESRELIRRMEGHTDSITSIAFHPSDGQTAITGSWDGTLKQWNLETGELLQSIDTGDLVVSSVSYRRDGQAALTTSLPEGFLAPARITLWDLETGEALQDYTTELSVITIARLSQEGSLILIGGATVELGGSNGQILLLNAETGEEIRRFAPGHSGAVLDVAFNPDEQQVVSAGDDSLVILWDAATGQEIRRFIGHSDVARSARFSPDGTTILSASFDDSIRLWDVETGEEVLRFTGHGGEARGAVFFPDGNRALSAALDGSVMMWQVALDPAAIMSWLSEHRYVRELTCGERERYTATTC